MSRNHVIVKRIQAALEDNKLSSGFAFIIVNGLRQVDNGLDTPCWIRGDDSEKYTAFTMNGERFITHRFMFELFKGKKLHHNGCHRCDKPACINPDHIFDGTHSQNHWDGRSIHYATK